MFFFVPAVVMLAHFFGINGVAVAADLMLVVGIVSILSHVKHYVDFSLLRMLGYPVLALALALSIALLMGAQLHTPSAILTLLSKAIVTTVVYGTILLVFEREQLLSAVQFVSNLLVRRSRVSFS
jgi:hypothetical protein